MINTGNALIITDELDIDVAIRTALVRTADALLMAYNVCDTNLSEGITTKTNHMAGFAKYVKLGALKNRSVFGRDYIKNAFDIYGSNELRRNKIENDKFDIFVRQEPESNVDLKYKPSYARSMRAGLGLFLVSLHCNGVIILPRNFNWPVSASGQAATNIASQIICSDSELLSFVRSINTVKGAKNDEIFFSTGLSEADLPRYSTYATKLLLITGWRKPEDVNVKDIIDIRIALDRDKAAVSNSIKYIQKHFVGMILNRFGGRCVGLDPESYFSSEPTVKHDVIATATNVKHAILRSQSLLCELVDYDIDTVVQRLCNVRQVLGAPKNIKQLQSVPRLPVDVPKVCKFWIELEDLYMQKTQREDYKEMLKAFGIFNLYLFFYLPNWYRLHPYSNLPFPDTPNGLVGGIFVSRLLQAKDEVPLTFVEFLDERAKLAKWADSTKYACLKQIEKFFSFIHNRSDDLPNCDKFRKPISRFDFPKIPRTGNTKKQAFPRKIFGLFVSYVEAVKGYIDLVTEKVLDGQINDIQLGSILTLGNYCVDTKSDKVLSLVGTVPTVLLNGSEVVIRYLPYFPELGTYKLKSGNIVELPRPHAINQILLAQYTGLRHNHIQWLDSDRFDELVQIGDCDSTRLYVNTDKVKKKAWAADVNFRVIEICRSQRRWRDFIDHESFEQMHFYNGNPRTVYPRFRPLFSYDAKDGLPHSDTTYETAWQALLLGFQTWAREHFPVEMKASLDLCRLVRAETRSQGCEAAKPDVQSKPERPRGERSKLRVSTLFTPHTTRVSLVSYTVHYLPPELIGKHITGQSAATVAYYVHPHPEDLKESEARQVAEIQRMAMESHTNDFLKSDDRASTVAIKASSINSSLAKSMRKDVGQTIVRYGCMSIAVGEEAETGLDVLTQVGAGNAAYNLTEICPYNNTCPAKIIKLLNGVRRCALCPVAVRSIDHLPAIVAAKRKSLELLVDLDRRLDLWEQNKSYTDDELDDMEMQRQRIGEEFAGWQLCEAVLEAARVRIEAGEDNKTWVVERPEILELELKRVELEASDKLHLLGRLAECISFPGFSTVQMERVFDMCRRRVLAASGEFQKAFELDVPIDAAAECAGLLRSLVSAKGLSVQDVVAALETDRHLKLIPSGRSVLSLAEA